MDAESNQDELISVEWISTRLCGGRGCGNACGIPENEDGNDFTQAVWTALGTGGRGGASAPGNASGNDWEVRKHIQIAGMGIVIE
jgi:hypothetical protein